MAAEGGLAAAQNKLGVFYTNSFGVVEQDYKKAFSWFKKAADQGYEPAQYNVGGFYAMGRGVKQDVAKAIPYLQAAAAQGHAKAKEML